MNIEYILKSNWYFGDIKSVEDIDTHSTNKVKIVTTENKERYIIKEQDNLNKLNKEAVLLSSIKKNVPIAAPIKTKDGDFFVEQGNNYYVLYPFLEGQSFTNHYDEKAFEKADLLGQTIGKLHYFLKDIEFDECETMNLINDVLKWAKNIIKENKNHYDYNFVLQIMDHFEKDIIPTYESLPKHIIHRDMHPGNILFKNNNLTGIVDFELSVKGVRIFDPCYCATSMLVGDFDDNKKRQMWLKLFTTLLNGYNEMNKLTNEEVNCITHILYSIQIIFMAYSCTVKNIEAAKCNEKVLKWLYNHREKIQDNVKKGLNII